MVRSHCMFFIFIMIVLSNSPIAAQSNNEIDALERQLIIVKTTEEKVTILNELACQYYSIAPFKTLQYATESIALSKKTDLKKEMMDAHYLKGIGYAIVNNTKEGLQNATDLIGMGKQYHNDFSIGRGYYLLAEIQSKISEGTKAMQNYQQAFQYFKKANSKKYMANVYSRIANYYIQFSNYKEAIIYTLKALQLYKEVKYLKGETSATHTLGDIYMGLKEYELAKKYYLQSLSLSKKVDRNHRSFWAGEDFVSLAMVYSAIDSTEKAYYYYSKALIIFKKASYVDGIASVNNNIGLIFMKKKDYNKALPYFNNAIKINQKYGMDYHLGENLRNMGNLYLAQNKLEKSKSYFNQAIALALQIKNKQLESELYNCFSSYYKVLGDYKESIAYLEKYYQLKEKLFGESQRRQITGLQIQYDTKEKEKEIQLLNQRNQIHLLNIAKQEDSEKLFLIVLVMLLVMVSILSWLFISKHKVNMILLDKNEEINNKNAFLESTQKKLKVSLREKDVLLKETHHRVKNNLQLVNSLLSLQARDSTNKMNVKEFLYKSRDRVQSIALIHETLYMSDNIARVNFQNYLEKLTRHLCSSFTLDNEIIKVNIQVNKITLDIEKVIPLGLILNELINNSIKHAFPEGEGIITITLVYKNHNFLQLHYYDDGIGLPENYGSKETLGIKLIWDLVRQLEGLLEIEKTAKGSSFIIHFPK